jgi:hypothetical protein
MVRREIIPQILIGRCDERHDVRNMQTTLEGSRKLDAAQDAFKYVLTCRVLGVRTGATLNIFMAPFRMLVLAFLVRLQHLRATHRHWMKSD